jgi:hypothetical protein
MERMLLLVLTLADLKKVSNHTFYRKEALDIQPKRVEDSETTPTAEQSMID